MPCILKDVYKWTLNNISVVYYGLVSHSTHFSRAIFKGGGLRDHPPLPRNVKKNFSKYCICLYSKLVYEDAHKQAPRGEIAATRYISELQKCVCDWGSAPDPTGRAYSAPPDRLAGNGGGAPQEGREKEGRGGTGKGYPS